ncbi:hypothetical protein SLEP1_g22591 [Rubroshorea leprosula]|uniref:Uncharacterized protein n=1 Tax=Rubroshorea leprosula TaxID=152421 RepID=A0AAV5JIH8_9ROSI|nr:hypothetical protein SLEP1_g22591 [Rubroshorea leprosula]
MDTSLGGVTIIRRYLYEAKQIVASMSYENLQGIHALVHSFMIHIFIGCLSIFERV